MNRQNQIAVMFALALVATTSCVHPDNPLYCEGHPGASGCDGGMPDAPPDATAACTSNETCIGPTAVCELGSGTCVQCTATDDAACIGTSPVCGGDHACRACQAHSECASGACLSDGSCADAGSVAYVDAAGTSNAVCSLATPCTQVASALATNRPYVKVMGTIDEAITIGGTQAVTFLGAPGAKLTRTNNGQLLQVKDAAQVAIYDLEISGALGVNVGISIPVASTVSLALTRTKVLNNSGGGISASSGTLTVSQSTISDNPGGGISISGAQFDLTNNVIARNGGASSLLGGISVQNVGATAVPPHRLDFNTIAANGGPSMLDTGVACSTVLQPLRFSDNIIYGNAVSGGGAQIGGSANCTTSYSDIGPDGAAGTGNLNADPRFVNAAQGDFHIMTNSPAKDAADPAATLATDFDGDARPYGPARDIGADEVTAP